MCNHQSLVQYGFVSHEPGAHCMGFNVPADGASPAARDAFHAAGMLTEQGAYALLLRQDAAWDNRTRSFLRASALGPSEATPECVSAGLSWTARANGL